MKHRKRLFILISLIILILIFICFMVSYNSLIDVQNTDYIISEIQSDLKQTSSNNLSNAVSDIEIIKTEKNNKIYAVLYSYSDGETHYGVKLFKESRLFKNRYNEYGNDNGTKDIGYYHYAERDNDVSNEFVVFYGNCNLTDKKECVIAVDDDIYFDEPVSDTFINIYEFNRPLDKTVFVYYD